MKYNMSYLSKYRSQLMGIATIFIILCHSENPLSGHVLGNFYKIYINQFLQLGVDIFLLVSGLGCYFSFSKKPYVKSFYIKRISRIFSPFLIFVFIYGVVSVVFLKADIIKYLYKYSIVPFFISGKLTVWFVSAILLLYTLFPIFFSILNKNEKYLLILIIFIIGITIVPFWEYLPKHFVVIRDILLCRIPVFLFGSWIGKKIYNKEDVGIDKCVCISILAISIIIFTINVLYNKSDTWLYSRLIFFPISVSFSIIITNMFNKFNIEQFKVNRLFLFLGMLSFESYLIFEPVLYIMLEYISLFNLIFHIMAISIIFINAISATITIIFALFIHKLSSKLIPSKNLKCF